MTTPAQSKQDSAQFAHFNARLQQMLAPFQSHEHKRLREAIDAIEHTCIKTAQGNFINFASNDYLGIAQSQGIKTTLQQHIAQHGLDLRSSQVVCGFSHVQHELEQRLASFFGFEKVVLFSSGYLANFGLLTTILKKHDVVFADQYTHASLYDGTLYARAQLQRYRHTDVEHLSTLLQRYHNPLQHAFIITDGLFSMDGDSAPLPELVATSQKFNSTLIVDDAHGIGVMGPHGEGILAALESQQRDFIFTGALSKAFGGFGGFVAGSADLIELLVQCSRTIRYTTALPAILFAAGLSALHSIEHETWRREKLHHLIKIFRDTAHEHQLPILSSLSPIQGIIIPEIEKLLAIGQALRQAGFWVGVIRPPSVPKQQGRLRITLNALHEEHDIKSLLLTLKKLYREHRVSEATDEHR